MTVSITELTRLWEKALKNIKQKINDDTTFDYFFSSSYIYEKEGSVLIIVAPHMVAKTVMEGKYNKIILDSLSEIDDESYEIKVITSQDLAKQKKESKINGSSKTVDTPTYFVDAVIKPDLKFSNFVVGDFNKDAHKAALYVARNGGTMFNPLFIYSNSGLGKTHLLHAIGNDVKENRMPNANILYISAQDFVEEYIKFVTGEKESQSIKAFFKNVDILLLDDVQILAGKVKSQEIFFSIYQDMVNKGKRIIITSDKQPNEIQGLEDRLVTRFSQGLTVKINEPDVETCVEILKQKIVNSGLKIEKFDANVIRFIAEKYSKNLRELEGAFNALMFNCLNLLDEEMITMDVAIKAVSSIKGGKNIAAQLNEQKIVNIVANYYNLDPEQITGKDRSGQIVMARHIAMYLIRQHLDIPLKKIGEMFGGKDHTTVMSAITKVDKELKTNEQLKTAIADLEKKIKE